MHDPSRYLVTLSKMLGVEKMSLESRWVKRWEKRERDVVRETLSQYGLCVPSVCRQPGFVANEHTRRRY